MRQHTVAVIHSAIRSPLRLEFFNFFSATVVNEKHAPPAVQGVAKECHSERASE